MGLQDEYFAGQAKAAGKKFKTTNATERTGNEGKYLEKVKKISNEAKKEEKDVKKEILYPICPMLSRGSHLHRCINTECVAYGDRFCRALNTKVKTKLI